MKKSTRAALLSAFIFPGIGHIYLKKYVSGFLLLVASAGGIVFIVFKTVERALQIIEQMQSGSAVPDIAAIIELVSKQSSDAGNDVYLLNFATAAFLICWIIGIIDSKRVGRTLDENACAPRLKGESNENSR
ncbi:MAG: hypothetical protein V2B20_11800 [Pseudomonadota bacterium]